MGTLIDLLDGYHQKNRWTSHFIFWLVFFLLSISNATFYHQDFSFRNNLIIGGIPLLTQIPATYFLAYFIYPRLNNSTNYLRVIFYFFAGSYFICVCSRFLILHVSEPLIGEPAKGSETVGEILTNFKKLAFVYFPLNFTISFVYLFLKVAKNQSFIQRHALTLEKAKSESELKMLKAQLNPHFLFNTLNNIYSLSLDNSPKTAESIATLSEMLDYMLYRCNDFYVPISGEVKLLGNYIRMEKLRYDESLILNCRTHLDNDIIIAPLLLLSIVENAFKHCGSDGSGRTFIDIDLEVTGNMIYFNVTNSFSENKNETKTEKIGLSNLRRQLDLIYPARYNLDIIQKNDLFQLKLILNSSDNEN